MLLIGSPSVSSLSSSSSSSYLGLCWSFFSMDLSLRWWSSGFFTTYLVSKSISWISKSDTVELWFYLNLTLKGSWFIYSGSNILPLPVIFLLSDC